ncbi:aromatic amino acid hydroxylase [Brevibacillus composti]|uniref:Aromatic amino acid hydroxylase n=1 Tax=Brevibacillus composti TaxID=2796470 RepID=A0A7T5EPG6_9BACL|nr:aromatic amino acid hydroxylase [Brevibacillus composti]QQE76325.1 aromatic amino acid hydroxylase [Brevibacillus composti]QUO43352.1 aromatic amino acid hydroxylase [Brevibacillus composti]
MSRVEPDFSLVQVPVHLREFVVDQDYDKYTPVDHAVWRYVMRQNHHYLGTRAHSAYLEGLRLSGISVERIPNIREMNECLSKIGWGAVTIDGFIPAVAFFDFQAHQILPIACDIRQYDHIAYTPAPDIIHEAAGHAPIILDETYRMFLKRFGEIGSKALSSREDYELYEAIRYLSIVKEDPDSTEDVIRQAEEELERKAQAVHRVSEANELARLYWWTVEYGLIGDCENPRIYGAGLLSSVGESISCMKEDVKKIPFSLEACIATDYDITKPQPQLFVCKNFQELIDAVEEYAKRMAVTVGGTKSLIQASQMPQTTTSVYSSGLQVSGILSELVFDETGEAIYLKTSGPTALAVSDKELPGHGKEYHREGFGSPIGRLAGEAEPLELFSDEKLREYGISPGQRCTLAFASGVHVEGIVHYIQRERGKVVLIGFDPCTVTYRDQVLFQAEWGVFDMAVGERIVSVFAGAADREAFATGTHRPSAITAKMPSYSPELLRLHQLYQRVRQLREESQERDQVQHELAAIIGEVDASYQEDWLIRLEILELLRAEEGTESEQSRLVTSLEALMEKLPEQRQLIENGLRLLSE